VKIKSQFVIKLYYRFHHTSSVSLHYLVRCQCLKNNN